MVLINHLGTVSQRWYDSIWRGRTISNRKIAVCVVALCTDFHQMTIECKNVISKCFPFPQSSVCHIFPSVLSWHGCSDVYSVRMVQRFIHNEFCCCDSAVVRRFLDSQEYYRPLAGRFAMVELHWRQWTVTLGVRIEKGTAWQPILTAFHSPQHCTNHCLFIFVWFLLVISFGAMQLITLLTLHVTNFSLNHIVHIANSHNIPFIAVQCSMLCFCVAIFNLAGPC